MVNLSPKETGESETDLGYPFLCQGHSWKSINTTTLFLCYLRKYPHFVFPT